MVHHKLQPFLYRNALAPTHLWFSPSLATITYQRRNIWPHTRHAFSLVFYVRLSTISVWMVNYFFSLSTSQPEVYISFCLFRQLWSPFLGFHHLRCREHSSVRGPSPFPCTHLILFDTTSFLIIMKLLHVFPSPVNFFYELWLATNTKLQTTHKQILLLLLLFSLSHLKRAFKIIYMKQTIFIGYIVLQLLWTCNFVLDVKLFHMLHMFYTFTLVLSEICV
jgi:hypothetical protein